MTYNPTDDAYEKIKAMFGGDEQSQKPVNILLTPIQKNQLYHYISNVIKTCDDHDTVVKSIIAYMDDFLKEKNEQQFSSSVSGDGADILQRLKSLGSL